MVKPGRPMAKETRNIVKTRHYVMKFIVSDAALSSTILILPDDYDTD